MKIIFVLITIVFSLWFTITGDCPQKGDSTKADHQQMDLLKNRTTTTTNFRSEEHTSELQSH